MDRITAARVFLTVVETGSFTASSEILKLSRSMVTRYVETIETWLGARLLHRSTRRVTLTSLGEEYLPLIEELLNKADILSTLTSDENHLSGSIRIATSVSLGFSLLSQALPSFSQKYPNVTIEILNSDESIDLIEQQVDLALRITSSPDGSLIGKPIGKCLSTLVATRDYLEQNSLIKTPEDLKSHNCLQYSNFRNHNWVLTRDTEVKEIEIKSNFLANETTFLLHACLNNLGIAYLPNYLAKKYIESGDLVMILDEWKLPEMSIYVLYNSRKHLPKVVRFMIEHLESHFKKLANQIN